MPDRQAGFISNPAGGIDAIDLNSGELLWHSDEASRPLLVTGDKLAAYRSFPAGSKLEITLLDLANNGELASTSETIELKNWISDESDPEADLNIESHLEKGSLRLDWQAQSRYRGGAAPSREILDSARKRFGGSILFNLANGEVEQFPPPEREPNSMVEESGAQTSLPYMRGSGWISGPWTFQGKICALSAGKEGSSENLYLEITESQNGGELKKYFLGEYSSEMTWVSLDGSYLFVPQRTLRALKPEEKQVWKVFSINAGQFYARISCDPKLNGACVLDARLFYITTELDDHGAVQTLKAWGLNSGEPLWERTIQRQPSSKPPPLRK